MQCRRCDESSPEGARFCIACGSPLSATCARCGTPLPSGARFCPQCGSPRVAPDSATGPDLEHSHGADIAADGEDDCGERRQLTVMFCDLVGSTSLSQSLDPEDLRDAVRQFQGACGEVVRAFEGHVAQYLGDGILVYFGYPQAHEDDPERAVRAAVEILGKVPRLNARLGEQLTLLREHPLRLRIGVHTGPVVVGQMGGAERQEQLAVGSTTNIAARLQEVAEPGSAVISGATRRRLGERFVLEALGERSLKGLPKPVAVHRVVGMRDLRSPEATPDPLAPLVGREQEVALLLDRWEQVMDQHGQVVLLRGEAGIGKSRLIEALRARLASEPHVWLEGHCSPYHEHSALHPVVDFLSQALGFERDDDSETKVAKLEQALQPTGLPVSSVVPLFCSLLSLTLSPPYTASPLSPDEQRRRTLESLHAWLLSMSESQPVVLVLQDLHWVDPSTLDLLELFVDQIPTARILLAMTARPGFESPWTDRSEVLQLSLNRLNRQQVVSMVEEIAGAQLPGEILAQIVRKTDGVPLFVEELTKMVVESDLVRKGEARYEMAQPGVDLAIPSTLQDSLMARLDRLGSAKEVAQLASVLGRAFSVEILEAVHTGDPAFLERSLDTLLRAELLYKRGLGRATQYTFKHALIQEIACQSLLKSRRQHYHRRIAEALEARFPERVRAAPEALARHYEEAGAPDEAIGYYLRAGERATERSAHEEAVVHLRHGIELLGALPESPKRNHQELMLQVALGSPLMAVKGYSSPEVEDAYERARELSQEARDAPQLFRALWGLAAFYQSRSELRVAREIADQLLELAEGSGEPTLRLLANLTAGANSYYEGRWSSALERLQRTVDLYDPVEHRALAYVYGQDPGMIAAVFAGICRWHLGQPDSGLRDAESALAMGRRERVHPLGLAFALDFLALLHYLRREGAEVRTCAEEAIAIAEEHGFVLELGLARLFRGWALAQSGSAAEGVGMMQEGLGDLNATGATVGAPGILGVLADGQRRAGRLNDALATVQLALDYSKRQSNPCWDAELLRLHGELLLASESPDRQAAEARLRSALALAQSQGSRLLALRAAVSLGQLLRQQGGLDEAREVVAAAREGLGEGFRTRDLRDADELLRSA